MSGCEGVAPSMWHILVRLAYGCREIWGSYAIYVGIPSLILANGWELCHLCPKKAAWCWEKKTSGGNSAEDCKNLVIFRDTWRNWPVLNGSWAIYPPHSAFDIDGATQDSERLLWHQSRTFQQKTGPPKWSISFYIALKKWVFQAHRRVPPHDRCRRTMKKKLVAMKTNGIWWYSPKKWWIFSLGTYILCT